MMQYLFTLFFVLSFLPDLCLALPAASPAQGVGSSHDRLVARGVRGAGLQASPKGATPGQTGASQGQDNTAEGHNGVSQAQIKNAVMSWMQDTGKVTRFLDTATSYTGADYTKQATIALNAELDELNHKKVLDVALRGMQMVSRANAVLDTQGKFQQVVDVLKSMVANGPDNAQKDVNTINNNRCVNVLPNIDMYFAAAGSPEIQAVRPRGCLEVEGSNITPAIPLPAKGSGANNGGTTPPQANQPPAPGKGNGNGQTQNGNGQNNNPSQGTNDGQNIGKGAGGNLGNNQGDNIGKGIRGSNPNGQVQTPGNGNQNQNQNQGKIPVNNQGDNIAKGIGRSNPSVQGQTSGNRDQNSVNSRPQATNLGSQILSPKSNPSKSNGNN